MSPQTDTSLTQNPSPTIITQTITYPQNHPSLPQPLIIKLDETNHLSWKNQILNVVIASGHEQFLEGTDPIPPKFINGDFQSPNPEFVQWERLNRLVMSWIYASLTPAMVGQIVEHQTAIAIWSTLNQVY